MDERRKGERRGRFDGISVFYSHEDGCWIATHETLVAFGMTRLSALAEIGVAFSMVEEVNYEDAKPDRRRAERRKGV